MPDTTYPPGVEEAFNSLPGGEKLKELVREFDTSDNKPSTIIRINAQLLTTIADKLEETDETDRMAYVGALAAASVATERLLETMALVVKSLQVSGIEAMQKWKQSDPKGYAAKLEECKEHHDRA